MCQAWSLTQSQPLNNLFVIKISISSHLELHPHDPVNAESGEVGSQVEVVHDGTDEYW